MDVDKAQRINPLFGPTPWEMDVDKAQRINPLFGPTPWVMDVDKAQRINSLFGTTPWAMDVDKAQRINPLFRLTRGRWTLTKRSASIPCSGPPVDDGRWQSAAHQFPVRAHPWTMDVDKAQRMSPL